MGIIYKATNKKNGKFYIGQTSKSLQERIKKHFIDQKIYPDRKFYQELNNEDFEWEILEENISNDKLLEVELAYIISTDAYKLGYNMKNVFEDNIKLNLQDIIEIQDLLQNSDITIRKIATIYNVSECHIASINKGYKHHNNNLKYPLRNTNRSKILSFDEVNLIKYMLKNTNLHQKDIANYFKIIRKRVTDINNGKTFFDENEEYPLRNQKHFSNKTIINIINDLKNTELTYKDISEKYQCNISKIVDINNGTINYVYKYNSEFPIRNTIKKKKDKVVYKKLFDLLKNTDYKYKTIMNILNISKSTIVKFNTGKNNEALKFTNDFPIRK